jgi:hypothetical protein
MNSRPWWVVGAQFTGLGWYVGVAIVAPTLGGVWLDGKTGAAPLFVLLGLFLGLAVASYGSYRMVITYLTGQNDFDEI